jgi:regulator of RNase E activity RraA
MSGDVIVAGADGVIVMPRARVKEVAEYAKVTIESDNAGRRRLYKQSSLPLDDSVK